jgi:hypothetical protein
VTPVQATAEAATTDERLRRCVPDTSFRRHANYDCTKAAKLSPHQGLARCVSRLHENPMPEPHPFAAAPASKGGARVAPKTPVTVYGYARFSTRGQSDDAQAWQLRAPGAGKVFREVASGA